MIYEPAEDSYLLASIVKKYAKNKKVLDVGTGSGIQARTAREAGARLVRALDIDKQSVAHVQKQGIPTKQSDIFSNGKGTFDLIICNPPYLPQDTREDNESARITSGGKKGDEFLLRFIDTLLNHLAPGGMVLLVLSSLTPRKRIYAALKRNGLTKNVEAKQKIFMESLEVWSLTKTEA